MKKIIDITSCESVQNAIRRIWSEKKGKMPTKKNVTPLEAGFDRCKNGWTRVWVTAEVYGKEIEIHYDACISPIDCTKQLLCCAVIYRG